MPTSHSQGKDVALDWYRQIAPTTVVDVGPGLGTYARLMRQHLRRDHWTGIEAWQPYIDTYNLTGLYDSVLIADARDVEPETLKADLVIFGDVLEHMTQAEARALLDKARDVAANIIVSVPVLHLDQDDVGGNPYERHVEHWTYEQMRDELEAGLVKMWWGDVLAYFWYSAEVARKRMGH